MRAEKLRGAVARLLLSDSRQEPQCRVDPAVAAIVPLPHPPPDWEEGERVLMALRLPCKPHIAMRLVALASPGAGQPSSRHTCLSRSPQAQVRIIGRGAIRRRYVVWYMWWLAQLSSVCLCCVCGCGTSVFAFHSLSPVILLIQPFLPFPSSDCLLHTRRPYHRLQSRVATHHPFTP